MKLTDLKNKWSEPAAQIIHKVYSEQKLYEGLITSYDIPTIKKLFSKKLQGKGEIFQPEPLIVSVKFKYPFDINLIKEMLNIANVAGWFFSSGLIKDKDFIEEKDINHFLQILSKITNKKTVASFHFEPRFSVEMERLPARVYHITPTKNVEKILKIGLTPRTQSKIGYHPERVYMALDKDDALTFLLSPMKRITNIDEWSLLEIDSRALQQSGVKVFIDPMYKGGIYTLSNIHPAFIIKVVKL